MATQWVYGSWLSRCHYAKNPTRKVPNWKRYECISGAVYSWNTLKWRGPHVYQQAWVPGSIDWCQKPHLNTAYEHKIARKNENALFPRSGILWKNTFRKYKIRIFLHRKFLYGWDFDIIVKILWLGDTNVCVISPLACIRRYSTGSPQKLGKSVKMGSNPENSLSRHHISRGIS